MWKLNPVNSNLIKVEVITCGQNLDHNYAKLLLLGSKLYCYRKDHMAKCEGSPQITESFSVLTGRDCVLVICKGHFYFT